MEKTALIFGHTSGLGLALSRKLLERGYRIVGIARSAAREGSPNLTEIAADLTDEDALASAVEAIRTEHANFDVLAYCAGTLTAHELDDIQSDTMSYLYGLNLFAPMLIESRLVDLIERNGADVVNLTSSSILEYYPKFTEYSTAKAAFSKFTDDLRKRLVDSPARVIDVCPSGFTSNMYVNMTGERIGRDESKQMQATDLAALVVYALELPKVMEVGRMYVNRKPV